MYSQTSASRETITGASVLEMMKNAPRKPQNNKDGKECKSRRHLLVCRSMNEESDAVDFVEPVNLYHNMWFEGEICFLFGDTNIGKSVLGVQIAREISETHPDKRVGYVDMEHSNQQFYKRYQDLESKTKVKWPGNLYRIAPDWKDAKEFLDLDKKSKALHLDDWFKNELRFELDPEHSDNTPDYIVVDNLGMLVFDGESNEKATRFMSWLKILKECYNKSLLIITHTPKVNAYEYLSPNHMAGAKSFQKYADSFIGMKRVPDSDDIYIRSFKARYTRNDNKAYRMKLAEDAEHGLHFQEIGAFDEMSLYPDSVKTQTSRSYSRKSTTPEEEKAIVELLRQGKSMAKVSMETGVRFGAVRRVANQLKESASYKSDPNSHSDDG